MFAADTAELTSGWFLENAYLIALVPIVAYFFIILFGKHMPRGGSEFGLASRKKIRPSASRRKSMRA